MTKSSLESQRNPNDRRIIGVAINGAEMNLTNPPFSKWFRSGFLLVTVFAVAFVMSLFDPASEPSSEIAANLTTAFWVGVVLFYLALIFLAFRVVSFTYRRLRWRVVYLPALSVFLVIIMMNFGEVLISLLRDQTLEWRMPNYNHFAFYYVMEQIFLTLYVSVIHPVVIRDVETSGAEDAAAETSDIEAPAKKMIRLDKRYYDISDLQYLRAAEHYLHVTTSLREDLVRARLSDAIEELGSEAGIQIHRSRWVARQAISSAYVASSKLYIVMNDGSKFSVARNRKKSVLDWLEKNSVSVTTN